MERGARTRGKVAQLVTGADAIEIKVTIPDKQIRVGLKRFNLTADNDEERYIYFFDTPDLQLFKAGVVMRARRIVGDKHDSTVKFRPADPARIPAEWQKYKGFKIEADASENGVVKSASLTMPVAKGLIKLVAEGKRPIDELFTDEQKRFLRQTAKKKLDFANVVLMGPMRAWRWKFTDPGLPWPLTAELWRRGDGEVMLEASIKAPAVQAAAAGGGFLAFVAEVGAERDYDQQAKTRWALEHFAGKSAAKNAPVRSKSAKRRTFGAKPKKALRRR
jgi:hypothetical protein